MKAAQSYIRHHDMNAEAPLARTVLLVLIALLGVYGIGASRLDARALIDGLGIIVAQPDILINDYVKQAGLGAAFLNAALCALVGYVILRRSRVLISGPAVAAVFTIAGFSLFGKNIANIWPSMLGVYLFSAVSKRPFSENVLVALFGTALAPLSSELAFGLGLASPWNYVAALAGGSAAGFFLSPIARSALDFHRGYNLYNIGFAAGFIGTVTLSFLKAFGVSLSAGGSWASVNPGFIVPFMLLYFLGMMAAGAIIDPQWYLGYRGIVSSSGRLVSDFVRSYGLGATLFNMGTMGLIGMAAVFIIGGDWNGPVVGGILTLVGFAAFGKHPFNALPPMIGVTLMALLSSYGLRAPASQLAVLFAATLAPISGAYGPIAGVAVGMLHLVLVQTVGVLHGGLNLYNNGFAGGMAAGLIVPILEWMREWRRHEV